MIDWFNLFVNAAWILGCAVGLATLGYTGWDAAVTGERFWGRIRQPSVQRTLNISGLLFCFGLFGTSETTWQRVLFGLLAIGFTVHTGLILYHTRSNQRS